MEEEYCMKMAKRARTASIGTGKHKAPKENTRLPQDMLLIDRISQLPPEILVDILSQLKAKEAGRTSFLSRRWRYLWTLIGNLEFDGSEVFDDLEQNIRFLEVERTIYVSCVNQAIRNHQGQTIDRFVVVFSLNESSASDIDGWVSFAVRKKVQSLKLDLRNHARSTQSNCYNFPHSLEISSCTSLTSLHLDEINITGEVLQLFLCNCLNLERVFVSGSTTLVRLNVDGPSLKLKWLDLHCCHNIQCLDVSAPNLVSFKYTGPVIPVPLKDVPKLLQISLMGFYSYYLLPCLSDLSSCLSKLEELTLVSFEFKKHMKDSRFPIFPKLKHLTLTTFSSSSKSLLDYASLIKSCPCLYKFSLKIWHCYTSATAREPFKAEACPHNIKVMEFIDFRGRVVEVELAMYIIENAVMLERIIFDPISGPDNEWGLKEPHEGHNPSTECAIELGKRLPPGVELVIV